MKFLVRYVLSGFAIDAFVVTFALLFLARGVA